MVLICLPEGCDMNLNHGGVILLSILSKPKLNKKAGSN